MHVLVLRYKDGSHRHCDISIWKWSQSSLRSKMSQYFGKDAFSRGYIELFNYETQEKTFIHSKEELRLIK